jgi:hypothetical protein
MSFAILWGRPYGCPGKECRKGGARHLDGEQGSPRVLCREQGCAGRGQQRDREVLPSRCPQRRAPAGQGARVPRLSCVRTRVGMCVRVQGWEGARGLARVGRALTPVPGPHDIGLRPEQGPGPRCPACHTLARGTRGAQAWPGRRPQGLHCPHPAHTEPPPSAPSSRLPHSQPPRRPRGLGSPPEPAQEPHTSSRPSLNKQRETGTAHVSRCWLAGPARNVCHVCGYFRTGRFPTWSSPFSVR